MLAKLPTYVGERHLIAQIRESVRLGLYHRRKVGWFLIRTFTKWTVEQEPLKKTTRKWWVGVRALACDSLIWAAKTDEGELGGMKLSQKN
jgi:hypothetical protein